MVEPEEEAGAGLWLTPGLVKMAHRCHRPLMDGQGPRRDQQADDWAYRWGGGDGAGRWGIGGGGGYDGPLAMAQAEPVLLAATGEEDTTVTEHWVILLFHRFSRIHVFLSFLDARFTKHDKGRVPRILKSKGVWFAKWVTTEKKCGVPWI